VLDEVLVMAEGSVKIAGVGMGWDLSIGCRGDGVGGSVRGAGYFDAAFASRRVPGKGSGEDMVLLSRRRMRRSCSSFGDVRKAFVAAAAGNSLSGEAGIEALSSAFVFFGGIHVATGSGDVGDGTAAKESDGTATGVVTISDRTSAAR
jgi:hypothetical protein